MDIELEKPDGGEKGLHRDPLDWWLETMEGLAKIFTPTPPPPPERPKKPWQDRGPGGYLRVQA